MIVRLPPLCADVITSVPDCITCYWAHRDLGVFFKTIKSGHGSLILQSSIAYIVVY